MGVIPHTLKEMTTQCKMCQGVIFSDWDDEAYARWGICDQCARKEIEENGEVSFDENTYDLELAYTGLND